MYIQYRDLKLIQCSSRPDKDNEAILRGDYLDKSQENFVMPGRDEMMKYIFSDWQVGDILVIADSPLKHPKLQGDTLVEMTREGICQSGDLSILVDGEYFEDGKIIKVEYNPELGYLKPVWYRELKQWLDGATDLEKVQAQISEYSELDTPSTLKEMGTELANECIDMLISLRNLAYSLESPKTMRRARRSVIEIPQPSEQLKVFKDRFNSIRK